MKTRRHGFSFDQKNMRWRFLPGDGEVGLRNARCSVTVNGQMLDWAAAELVAVSQNAGTRTVRLDFTKTGLRWDLSFTLSASGEKLTVRSSLRNTGKETVILGPINVIDIDPGRGGRVVLPGSPADFMVFQLQSWNTRVETLVSSGGQHASECIGHLYSPKAGRVFSANFESVDSFVSQSHFAFDAEKNELAYRAICLAGKHELPAGATVHTEKLVVRAYDEPHKPLEDWAKAMQRRYKPVLNPKTTVGWLGWAWVDNLSSRTETPEATTVGNARAIRDRLPGFDFDYIWISQTNLHGGVPGNWLTFDKEHFPHGAKALVAELEKCGVKLGLWIAPFWVFKNSEAWEANPDSLVRDKDGQVVTKKFPWAFIKSKERREAAEMAKLDGSHPAALDYMRHVFTTYKNLGVRYYMLDFLGAAGVERTVWNKEKTWCEADRDLMLAIRDAAGPDTHLLTAVGTTTRYTGATDAARVNTDFGEGRPLYPPFHCLYTATSVVHDAHFGNVKKFLQNAASTWFTHRRLWINDYNVMTVDQPMPRSIAEITTTVFGMSGSPIMIGDDLRTISDERLRMIKLCLPRTDEMARPVDLFERPQPDDYARMLALNVKTGWGSYALLAVFNLDDTSQRLTIDLKRLGLNAKSAYTAYDFWDEDYRGEVSGTFSVDVQPMSCKLYRIAKAKNHPWLLSTNMHIQQGLLEVPDLKWNAKKTELTGTVTRPKGETGHLLFLMPEGFRLINHEDHKLLKVGRDNKVVIRRDFAFKTKNAISFKLRFARMQKRANNYG